jgi:hypothetical protein
VATEAAAEAVGVDALHPGNTTLPLPAKALLAAFDVTAVSAAALGARFLVPPAGAVPAAFVPGLSVELDPAVWSNTSTTLASRCAGARCDRPITRTRAVVAGETLTGSIINLIGFIFYSVAIQLRVAMELEQGALVTVAVPGPDPGQPSVWLDSLLQNFRRQVRDTLPEQQLAPLLARAPQPTAADAAAFPGIRPAMTDAEVLRLVIQGAARTLEQESRTPLAALASGASPAPVPFADLLARFHRLAASGLDQRSRAAAAAGNPAVAARWQVLASLASYSRYASAAAESWRAGALEQASALALLRDVADALQALVYGWLIEASAVPVETATLYQQGALPHLTQARALALGRQEPGGARARLCRDYCRQAELGTRAVTEQTARGATRIYLAAYIEALSGSIIAQAVDAAASFGSSVPAGNGTLLVPAGNGTAPAGVGSGAPTGWIEAESVGNTQVADPAPGSAPGPAEPVLASQAAPTIRAMPFNLTALTALLEDPPAPAVLADGADALLDRACAAVPCDLSFARQQTALAEESRSGGELTFLAYTLNLVVKGFRIALAAAR